MSEIKFPDAVRQGNRLYFRRDEIENHKLALAGLPPKPASEVIQLVPATQVAREFGFHRRTLGRRLVDAQRPETAA